MNSPLNEPPAPKNSVTEVGALICFIGLLVGLGVSIMQPLLDWRHGILKPFPHYVVKGLLVCLPFIIGLLLFAWLVRRARKDQNHKR